MRGPQGGRELRHGLEGWGKGVAFVLTPLSIHAAFHAVPKAKAVSLSSHNSVLRVETLSFLTAPNTTRST